ncbi:hypothetical protein GF352_02845 [archaeon]|nr:hypothetical protein [archaeon]
MNWFDKFLKGLSELLSNTDAYLKSWKKAFDFSASNNLLSDNTLLGSLKQALSLEKHLRVTINWEAEPPYVCAELDEEQDYTYLVVYNGSVYDDEDNLSVTPGGKIVGEGLLVCYNNSKLLNSVIKILLDSSRGDYLFLQEYQGAVPLKGHYEIIRGKQPLKEEQLLRHKEH